MDLFCQLRQPRDQFLTKKEISKLFSMYDVVPHAKESLQSIYHVTDQTDWYDDSIPFDRMDLLISNLKKSIKEAKDKLDKEFSANQENQEVDFYQFNSILKISLDPSMDKIDEIIASIDNQNFQKSFIRSLSCCCRDYLGKKRLDKMD